MNRKPFYRHGAAGALALCFALVVFAAACSSTRPSSDQRNDASITASVKAKLAADPEINPFEIDVDTLDGVVRLSGFVSSEVARREAGELAERTDGVERVVNEIKIGDKTLGESIDDATITTRLKLKFTEDPDLKAIDIDIDTQKGVVTLSGIVESEAQRRSAERIARDEKGVSRVRNLLKVRG